MKYYKLVRYPATFNYFLFIVLLNTVFSYVPNLSIWGQSISSADFLVGFIYVLRDFAQREIKHGVILAMLLGCLISWLLSEKQAAFASVSAFAVGELIDWVIFTFSGKPLAERVLWSSLVSSPVDSVVNLWCLNLLNPLGFFVMTATKMLGVFFLWLFWQLSTQKSATLLEN